LQQAESYFAQALARDPDNPRALAGLGQYNVLMAVQLYAPDPARHLAKAESLLQQVIERHPNMAWAHASMGLLNIARRRHEDAAKWYQRAIELNPSQAMSYAQLGRLLTRMGRPEEGLKHILYAMRLSPRDPGLSYWLGFAGAAEVELKRYDKAIEYLDRAVALHPSQPRTMLVLIAAHALAGNMGEARRRLDELQKSLPHLSNDKLVDRFLGDGTKLSQLREGLRQVLASPWDSPPLPSQQAALAPSSRAIIPLIVLPFTTYGDNAGSIELLADAMTDDLINMLSRVPSIRVISRSFKGRPIDIAAIGAELQARYVLEGSMRMLGDKLRVNVELTDPSTRLSVWSGRIERAGADRQAVQDEIVGQLARELHFELYPVESARRSNDADATRGRLSR
jgi:TolB-like protein/Tfp pilus assembly protein PilF